MIRRVIALLAVAGMGLAGIASAESATSGEWTVKRVPSSATKIYVDFHTDEALGARGHWNSSFDMEVAQLGLSAADLDSSGKHVRFTLTREAGSFACEGWAGGGRGAGTFTFAPSASFRDGLRTRGYGDISPEKQLNAATLDLTLAYVDAIARTGFPRPSLEKLITFRALGVTPDSIATYRKTFGDSLSVEDVTSLAALQVTPAYVAEMRALGVTDLSARKAVELKALGIDRAYADGLSRAGYAHLDAHDLVQFKALNIDGSYIRHLADHGFKNLTPEQLVRMRAVGI